MNRGPIHHLHHELRVLSRAVAHANLSVAAQQIGISQPQLSRIVQRLESELGLVLLDRSAKRKSGWLPQAQQLGEQYSRAASRLEAELHAALGGGEPETLRFGTLEGCIPIANRILSRALEALKLRALEIEVEDVGGLEQRFLKGELDLILSLRAPGRKKYRYEVEIGVQRLDRMKSAGVKAHVMSSFESATQPGDTSGLRIVSNSLEVRRHWLKSYGGEGWLPGELVRGRRAPAGERTQFVTLSLYGSDALTPGLWNRLVAAAEGS